MQVAAACLAEGKEACHKAITVDDLHSTGGASRVPPRHRGRLAIRLRDSRALRGAHLLLRHLGALPRLRLLRETRAQPGHLVGEPRRLHVLHLLRYDLDLVGVGDVDVAVLVDEQLLVGEPRRLHVLRVEAAKVFDVLTPEAALVRMQRLQQQQQMLHARMLQPERAESAKRKDLLLLMQP